MNSLTSSRFRKQYKQLPEKIRNKFKERLHVLWNDQKNRSLNLHKVRYMGEVYTSMNITGDHRALFRQIDEETIEFRAIGTHSQLYG